MNVCIYFRGLNLATPRDVYPMPIVDMLVDSVAGNEILSPSNRYSGYNSICIVEQDILKTIFRCRGALGTYEWKPMSFCLKMLV